jgi:peptidoglycan/LPS O-acetylase OafA/YrhL
VKRHPADLLSLVMGLAVLAAGLLLLSGDLDQVPMEWVGPAVAVGLGVMILFAARPSPEPSDDVPPSVDER